MAIYRLYTGADGQSHIEETTLAKHPELGGLEPLQGITLNAAGHGEGYQCKEKGWQNHLKPLAKALPTSSHTLRRPGPRRACGDRS